MQFIGSKTFLTFSVVFLFGLSLLVWVKFTSAENEQQASSDSKLVLEDSQYQGKDWELYNLNKVKVRLSDYQGQPVLLVFWATWCPYCKKLLPGIAQLNDKYESKGLKVIAVNIKEDWKPDVYWRNHGYKFDTVLEGDKVAKIYGVKGTPSTVFIKPSGKVLGVQSFSDPQHPLLEKFALEYTK
jgi:cytochrome c biogenesis protein CcmG, thiol:disulfide interchange protein DsbE